MTPGTLIRCAQATVAVPGPTTTATLPVLHDLSWELRPGQAWAIVGPVASGKTTFGRTLLGDTRLSQGEITWPLVEAKSQALGRHLYPNDLIGFVSFKEEGRGFSYAKHYYQQRFNFIEAEDDLTVAQYLGQLPGVAPQAIQAMLQRFGVGHTLPLSLIKLSNGQTRRVRLAKALLALPQVLILDEPTMGLDVLGRQELDQLLQALHQEGLPLVILCRADWVPPWVTHVATIDQGRFTWQGPREQYQPSLVKASTSEPAPPARRAATAPVIELNHVNVTHGGQPILRDVSWEVRTGEAWALLGPNGSGKTTLLSLIAGDHPQVYANDVRLFGQRRGTGESIWEIKQRLGLVSPEMHVYYSEPLTVIETIATGFHDVLVRRPVTEEQAAAIEAALGIFDLAAQGQRRLAHLSTGQQRIVFFIRGLIKRPELLILDEPFQGFDAQTLGKAHQFLASQRFPGQTIILVTHHEGEIPPWIEHFATITAGQLTFGAKAGGSH